MSQIILPQTTADQRTSVYEDVESLIFPGFLHHPVVVSGVNLGFRSLGPGDLFLLRARVHKASDRDWRLWTLATATWVVQGVCVLEEPHIVPRLKTHMSNLPDSVIAVLFSQVMGLFARQNRAVEGVEAFGYESQSRALWRSLHGKHPSEHSGVPGIGRIGTNYIQRIWMAYNQSEDQRRADQRAWDGHKLVASATAPGGVKKINQAEKADQEREDLRRQEVMDLHFYQAVGILEPQNIKDGARKSTGRLAKPTETLEDEMRMWVEGEEDWHDQVINAYKQRIVDNLDQEKAKREARYLELREAESAVEAELVPTTRLVGYTSHQLTDLLAGKMPGHSGVRWVQESALAAQEDVSNKWLNKDLSPGDLRVDDGHLVGTGQVRLEGDTPVFDASPRPAHAAPQTLNQAVAERLVKFRKGPGDEP